VRSLEPQYFTRPVELPEGAQDAAFRTVRLPSEDTPAGRLYFCEHLTRGLVWRDEWRHHANGTVGVKAAVIAAGDPTHLGTLFARMFGVGAVARIPGGIRLAVGLTDFDVITPDEVAARFGSAAPKQDRRSEAMVALILRTRSLAQTGAAIEVHGVVRDTNRLLVPAPEAFGVTLAFEM
jgi:hypothetical protein